MCDEPTVLAPVTDHGPRIGLWISSWKDHMPEAGHGTMIENAILTPGDPQNPPAPGAVLSWACRFHRAQLEAGAQTPAITHEAEQEVLYVVRGEGAFRSNDLNERIGPGMAALIPAGVPHALENTSRCDPLEVLWLAEALDEGDAPAPRLVLRDTRKLPVLVGAHWVHAGREIFYAQDGLRKLHAVITATIPAMSMAEPHSHLAGQEEVWYQMNGTSYLSLGRSLRVQEEGTAFLVPPDGCTPHSSINTTNDPVDFFFFAHW